MTETQPHRVLFSLLVLAFFHYFLFHIFSFTCRLTSKIKKKVANSAWSAQILASKHHHLGLLLHPPPYSLHTTTHLALPANKHQHRTPSQRLGSLHESQHSFTHFTYFQPNPIAPGTLGSSSWLIWFDCFRRNWRISKALFSSVPRSLNQPCRLSTLSIFSTLLYLVLFFLFLFLLLIPTSIWKLLHHARVEWLSTHCLILQPTDNPILWAILNFLMHRHHHPRHYHRVVTPPVRIVTRIPSIIPTPGTTISSDIRLTQRDPEPRFHPRRLYLPRQNPPRALTLEIAMIQSPAAPASPLQPLPHPPPQQEPPRDQQQHQHHQQTAVVPHVPNTKKRKCTSSGTTASTSARSGGKSANASTVSSPIANGAGSRASSANSTGLSATRSVRLCASRGACAMESFWVRGARPHHHHPIIVIITYRRPARLSLASSNGWACGIRGWERIEIKLVWWLGGYPLDLVYRFFSFYKTGRFTTLQDTFAFLFFFYFFCFLLPFRRLFFFFFSV